jgi:hypothetical protein
MYAPKKRVDDDDDAYEESEEETPSDKIVDKTQSNTEPDEKPVAQIDPAEIERLLKYFEESRIEMEKVGRPFEYL